MTREQAQAFHTAYTVAYQKLRVDVEASFVPADDVSQQSEGEPPTPEDEELLVALEAEPAPKPARKPRPKKVKSKPVRASKLNGTKPEQKKEEST